MLTYRSLSRGPCFLLKKKTRECKKRQSFSLLGGKVPIIKNFFISNLNYLFKIKQNIKKKLPPASISRFPQRERAIFKEIKIK